MEVARHRGADDLWLAPGLVRRHCAWRIDRDFADGARLPGADARVSQAASRVRYYSGRDCAPGPVPFHGACGDRLRPAVADVALDDPRLRRGRAAAL